jgi:hypothetical protein
MAKLRPGTTEVINRCSKMKDVETLHREAMELVDRAVVVRQRGDVSAILGLARAAFEKERAAADLVATQFNLEPTRSVLHRSAAVLALECSELQEELQKSSNFESPPLLRVG